MKWEGICLASFVMCYITARAVSIMTTPVVGGVTFIGCQLAVLLALLIRWLLAMRSPVPPKLPRMPESVRREVEWQAWVKKHEQFMKRLEVKAEPKCGVWRTHEGHVATSLSQLPTRSERRAWFAAHLDGSCPGPHEETYAVGTSGAVDVVCLAPRT